jgi:hypothetical protein
VDHNVSEKELDARHASAHAGHEHGPKQPHEVDAIDHHMDGPKGHHEPKVNSYDGNPYQLGNVAHGGTEQPAPSTATVSQPAVNQGPNSYDFGNE